MIEERRKLGLDRFDEVWEGQYRMSPQPNNKHYRLADALFRVISEVYEGTAAIVQTGGNVSDRREGWTKNFRGPDLLVVLPGSKAIDCGDYFFGGPDFVVEVISPGERPLDKLPFYAKVGTREVLHLDRETKALSLFRLSDGQMQLVGESNTKKSLTVTSTVLPLDFQVFQGSTSEATVLVIQQKDAQRVWRIGG
jgi:Uma2 family endonuclease